MSTEALRESPPAPPYSQATTPVRKAAILVVSLEQPLASRLLTELDRDNVEAVTLEIARLDRIDPIEQRNVLEEFLDLGLRRLQFAFDDLPRLSTTELRASYRDDDQILWALALAGADRTVRESVLDALEPNHAERLRIALETLGPFRLDDAETAQIELVDHFRSLHDRGLVTLPQPQGHEAVLV